jgi:AcrR family transcriptional regulator
MSTDALVPSGTTLSSRERIVAAARTEVETKGILGLRVQDVASAAKVSVPLIYKYFDDRDGLLAEVLSRLFEEVVLENIDAAEQYFATLQSPTVEDFLHVLALPQQEWRKPKRWMRIQILAASMEIPALRDRLTVVQTHITERMIEFMARAQERMTGTITIPPQALALWIQGSGFGFVLNDLLEEGTGVTNDEYASLLRSMLASAFGKG